MRLRNCRGRADIGSLEGPLAVELLELYDAGRQVSPEQAWIQALQVRENAAC